jgi:hypothetical protein
MRSILLLGIALTLAACGSDAAVTPPPEASISGSYQLTTVDGQTLPFTAIDLGTYKAQIVSGVLALDTNSTYSLTFDVSLDDGVKLRTVTEGDAGQWSMSGSAINLASARDTTSWTGTVSGNVITIQSSTRVLVLRK